jgi:peptide/nickel transport system substrate-binding protein
MTSEYFRRQGRFGPGFAGLLGLVAAMVLSALPALGAPSYGLSMYGSPALPPDFVSLPYANPEAPKGGQLVTGNTGGFDSLNPFILKGTPPWQLRFLGYESLMGRNYDEPFGLYGLLAESVEVGPNRHWVEFTLRKEARFSDGSPVTLEDVIWSYKTLGTEGHPRYLGFWSKVASIEATGPRSLRLTFNTEDRELPLLAGLRPILKKAQWEGRDFGEAGLEAPIGTGPYVVKSAEPGVRYVFEKNPNAWDSEQGHAGTIEVLVLNDDTARVAALQSGQVDMINRVPPRTAGLVDRAPNITVTSKSGPGHYVFIMHCDTAPFDNNDLRMALKLGIDRQEMVDKILSGYGSIGNDSPINASYPLFTPMEQREYDPEKAKFHYKKSGHDGPILLRTSDNSFPGAPDAAALFQQSLKKAGIPLEIKREPNDGYWSEVWNAKPFCTSYWSGRPTQDQMYSTAYLSSADWNDTRFKNEKFDKLLIEARSELDQAKRKELYAQMGMLVRDEGGLICPMFNDFVDAYSDRVGGFEQGPGFGLMNYYAPAKMWVVA